MLTINFAATTTYDIFASVSPIDDPTLADSGVYAGAPGSDGTEFGDFPGTAPPWTFSPGFPPAFPPSAQLFANGVLIPPAFLADVLNGNSFFRVDATSGQLRGQFSLGPVGYTAAVTGVPVTTGVENVIGGAGDDILRGNPAANRLVGGPGSDTLAGDLGDDQLVASDGAADMLLDCGDGIDSLDRDAITLDPNAIVSGCENVTTAGVLGDADGDGQPDGGADTTAPDTVKGRGPKRRWTKRSARFRFSSPEEGISFECKLDKKKFKPCSSPARVRNLRPGKHAFRVQAIDAAGNIDSSPAVWRFRVVRKPAPPRR